MEKQTDKKQKITSGLVVSDKMDKTIVVKVVRKKSHPLYGKRINVSRKFKVHDPENKFRAGDQVDFVETQPYSKDKKWKVIYK